MIRLIFHVVIAVILVYVTCLAMSMEGHFGNRRQELKSHTEASKQKNVEDVLSDLEMHLHRGMNDVMWRRFLLASFVVAMCILIVNTSYRKVSDMISLPYMFILTFLTVLSSDLLVFPVPVI